MLQGDRLQPGPLAPRRPRAARADQPRAFGRALVAPGRVRSPPLDDDMERFERVGLRPVGVMGRCQIDPASGDRADNLLMDLLAEELEVG